MSSAAEMFVGEQVAEAIRKKYPELAEMWLETPGWAYNCWDQSLIPENFEVELGEAEPTTTVIVTVGFEVEGDDSGRQVVAYVKGVNKVKVGRPKVVIDGSQILVEYPPSQEESNGKTS